MARKKIIPLATHRKPPETVFMEPLNVAEASAALKALKERKIVYINLARLERSQARRMVDCLCGCAQATNGCGFPVGQHSYLFAPRGICP